MRPQSYLQRMVFSVLCAWLVCLYASAQGNGKIIVTNFECLDNDVIINNDVFDSNGNPCALIKVETTQKGFKFEASSYGVTKVDDSHDGEIWVFVSDKENRLTIKHPTLGILRNYKLNPTVRKGRVYLMQISTGEQHIITDPSVTKQFISFNVFPANATVSVEDEPWPVDVNGHTERLCNFGEYSYRVEAPNYHSTVGKVKLFSAEKKMEINIRLKPAFGWLAVDDNETTRGGELYIDNIRIGKLPLTAKPEVTSGVHKVKIVKDLYKMYENTISVADSMTIDLAARLEADFATTKLVADDGVEIWIDDEYKGKSVWNGPLRNGEYKVTCKKESHRDVSQIIHIQDGITEPIQLKSPIPIYGSLSISSSPAGASVLVDGKQEGITPLFMHKLLIGNHVVKVVMENYKEEEQKIVVHQDTQETVNFTLRDFAKFKIKCNPNATLCIDGKYIGYTPCEFEAASGVYDVELSRTQYKTLRKKVTMKSSSPNLSFKLHRQFQKNWTMYIQPTVCKNNSIMTYGGTAGFHLSKINLEGYYMLSFDKSEPIFWSTAIEAMDERPTGCQYKPSLITGGRAGYNFIIGRFLRFTPQIGGHLVNFTSEDLEEGSYYSTDNEFWAISATVGARFECAIMNHVGLSVTPEYLIPVMKSDDFKAVSPLSNYFKDLTEGFHLRMGVYFYF